jgi:hypothetical protein
MITMRVHYHLGRSRGCRGMINSRESTVVCRVEDCGFHVQGDEGYCVLKYIVITKDKKCMFYTPTKLGEKE